MKTTRILYLLTGLLLLSKLSWAVTFQFGQFNNAPPGFPYPSPADASIAVGNGFVVVDENQLIKVKSSVTGSNIAWLPGRNFWADLGLGCNDQAPNTQASLWCNSDPRIEYDVSAQRWIASAQRQQRDLLLAVSATNDPTGNWQKWVVPAPCGLFTGQGYPYPDLPILAINSNWIVLANLCNDGVVNAREEFHVFDRLNTETLPAQLTEVGNAPFGALRTTLHPVTDRTMQSPTIFFVEPLPYNPNNIAADIWAMQGTRTNPNAPATYSVSPNYSFPGAQQGPSVGGAPTVPSASSLYWLGSNQFPDPMGNCPQGTSLTFSANTASGDVDQWAADVDIEFAFNGKYQGSPNGSYDGGVYVAVMRYEIGQQIWHLDFTHAGDPLGSEELSVVGLAHKLVNGVDYQVLIGSHTGTIAGLDIDETNVKVLQNGVNIAHNDYPWTTNNGHVVCGRFGDYADAAPDPNSNTIWHANDAFSSQALDVDYLGAVSLP